MSIGLRWPAGKAFYRANEFWPCPRSKEAARGRGCSYLLQRRVGGAYRSDEGQVLAGTAPRTLPYIRPRMSSPIKDRSTRMKVLAHVSTSPESSALSCESDSAMFHRRRYSRVLTVCSIVSRRMIYSNDIGVL